MRIKIPSRSRLSSYPPKEKRKKPPTEADTDIHPTGDNYKHSFSTYKASSHPIIKSPQNRALWRRAVYIPPSSQPAPTPTPSSPDISGSSTQTPPQSTSPPHPVCFLCMGCLGDEYSHTTCNSCKTKYAAPPHRASDEDEYIDDFFPPSPSLQDETSDAQIILLDGCIAMGKKSCFINNANNCATLASPSPSLTCSDDESDGCATPASCSSSVYSQDEFDSERHHEYLTETKRPGSESNFTGSTKYCVTPALSTSSSVYSREDERERVETDTVGYYDLDCLAGYFDDCQQSRGEGFEGNVEEDCSLAIDIHYR